MPAVFQKTVEQDLHKPLKIQYCADTVFTKDNAGNQINVLLFEDGEPYNSGGTVSATAIRADGATESWAGTISGNKVSVALTRAALDVPGTLQVFIKVTAGTVETTVYAGVYNVVCTETPTVVAPVTPSNVAALIASIEAAIRNIPADWTSFLGTIAPTFDPGKTGGYAAGDYVWYPGATDNVGTLYRFTSAHSGTWTGTDAVTVVIGNELNDTVRYTAQVHTDEQKTVARANIGAASNDHVYNLAYQVSANTTDIGVLQRQVGSVPEGQNLQGEVADLKSAIDSKLDGVFVDIANDKLITSRTAGVDYQIAGNKFLFNGTASGGIRLKVSNDFDRGTSVNNAWRSESIGLIAGHKYMMCAEYVSGTGRITFVIYKDSGTGEYVEINSENCSAHEVIYGNAFVADSNNARCLCVYYGSGRTFSNLVVRFNFIDLTMASDLILNKINVKTPTETSIIGLNLNKYAASGMVDINADNETITHDDLTITAQGNRFVLNGTTSANVRIKITNGIDASNAAESSWLDESLPVLDSTHKYIIAVSKLSGSVSANKNDRVTFYNKDGTGGGTQAYFVTSADGFSKGVAYSDIIENTNDIACLIIYCPSSSAFNNVVLQIDLIDMTVLWNLVEHSEEKKTLNDYYFENDYIDGRVSDIIALRGAKSINSESFLWFTDPHYFYPETTVPENGMQSAQLAEYIKKRTNNRLIICGGDFLRGYITKDDARKLLSDVREYLNPIYDDMFVCLGNHEYNNPGPKQSWVAEQLDSPELYSMFIKNQEYFIDSTSSKGDYSFMNKVRKVKYFVIGTRAEKDIFDETIAWLGNELLHVESGYHAIIISHIGLSYGTGAEQNQINANFADVAELIDAVNGRGEFSYSGINYNYANVNFEIVCALTGHVHYDGNAYTTGGTPVIATTCDRAFVTDGDAGIKEVRKIGTIGEQALDYVLIDFDNHTIDLIRIGGSILGASYDSVTGKIYDTEVGTGTEYTGTEWVEYSPYKDRHFTYTGHIT